MKVQSDAHDLAGPTNRRSQSLRLRNAGRGSCIVLQPVFQLFESAIGKKCFIIVSRKAGNVTTRGVLQDDARRLSAWLTKPNQLHGFSLWLCACLCPKLICTYSPRKRRIVIEQMRECKLSTESCVPANGKVSQGKTQPLPHMQAKHKIVFTLLRLLLEFAVASAIRIFK